MQSEMETSVIWGYQGLGIPIFELLRYTKSKALYSSSY